MPLVLGGSAVVTPAYSITNSCRFNLADSAYMTKTLGTPSSQKQFTFSCWFKRGLLGIHETLMSAGNTSDAIYTSYRYENNGVMRANVDSANSDTLQTDQMFKDVSAWYHIVVTVDTPNAVEAERIRFYINGTRLTGPWGQEGYPTQDADIGSFASGEGLQIGRRIRAEDQYLDGYMAEALFCDGQAYDASDFGEFDSASPTIWKPTDPSELTFGNNGFWLDFKDSANLGNDANGGTDLTETNIAAADQATDTPTNSFATWNPLWRWRLDNDTAYSEGNVNASWSTASDRGFAFATMGVSKAKWYWEVKLPTIGRMFSGVGDANKVGGFAYGPWDETGSAGASYSLTIQHRNGDIQTEGSTETAYAADNSDDDICMWALDMDNDRLWMGINGTWQDSGDPTSGATGTGDITTQISTQVHLTQSEVMTPCCADPSTAGGSVLEGNFGGCPGFAISSGNADANGYGNFEYAPPSGFYALCTKNLAEYG